MKRLEFMFHWFWPLIVIGIGGLFMTNEIRQCLECNIFDAFDGMNAWGVLGLIMTLFGFYIYANRLRKK